MTFQNYLPGSGSAKRGGGGGGGRWERGGGRDDSNKKMAGQEIEMSLVALSIYDDAAGEYSPKKNAYMYVYICMRKNNVYVYILEIKAQTHTVFL